MLQLRRPSTLVSLVRQNPRRFEVVDEELGPQTVGGDCVRLVQRVTHLAVVREQFLGIVVGGGGGGDAGAVRVEGAGGGGVGGVDGGADGHFFRAGGGVFCEEIERRVGVYGPIRRNNRLDGWVSKRRKK